MQFKPDEIFIGDRLRQSLNREAVEELKKSIAQIGLRIPISVRQIEGQENHIWGLVTGRHRLQACIELGFEEIEARVETGSELDSKFWEIAENLHRAELTVAERSSHIAEWIKLTDEKNKEAASKEVSSQVAKEPRQGVGQGVGGGKPEGGINAAARELGIGKDEAYRAVKIDSLTDEAKAAAVAAGLDDNQSALLAAAKEKEPEAQVAVIQERAKKSDAPKTPKQKKPPRPVIENQEETEQDHEMADWIATFESWSRARQQIGLTIIGVKKDRELLKRDIARLELENQSLREQLFASQPEPAEPEPEEVLRLASEPSEPQAIEAIITWDRPAQIALFAMLHEHLNAIEPPAEQIEQPEQQPVAPAEPAPPPPQPSAPTEPPPMKSREETIAAFEKSGRLGLGDWQQKLMHIDAAVVEALITEGLLAAENDDRVRIIQPWMMSAA